MLSKLCEEFWAVVDASRRKSVHTALDDYDWKRHLRMNTLKHASRTVSKLLMEQVLNCRSDELSPRFTNKKFYHSIASFLFKLCRHYKK